MARGSRRNFRVRRPRSRSVCGFGPRVKIRIKIRVKIKVRLDIGLRARFCLPQGFKARLRIRIGTTFRSLRFRLRLMLKLTSLGIKPSLGLLRV